MLGFEVVLHNRKYVVFSKFDIDGDGNTTSYCEHTMTGWSHDVLGQDWACYSGKKQESVSAKYSSTWIDHVK